MARNPHVKAGSCKTEGCNEPAAARGMCRKEYNAWYKQAKRYNLQLMPVGISVAPPSDSYYAAHGKLKYHRGSATEQACVGCGNPADGWAYDRSDPNELISPEGWPYSFDMDRYAPMCRSCHATFDWQFDGRKL